MTRRIKSKSSRTHESLQDGHQIKLGSNRSFGIVFCVVFTLLGGYSWWKGGENSIELLIVAALLLFVTLFIPNILSPLNWLWFQFGILLSRIMNPVIMGIVFFFVVTPMAICMRLVGKDTLRLKSKKDMNSYWIHRITKPDHESFKHQF